MIRRPLKTHIAVNVAILLVLGMAMVEIIATVAFQRILVQEKADRAFHIIDVARFQTGSADGGETFSRFLMASGADHYIVVDEHGRLDGSIQRNGHLEAVLKGHAAKAFSGSGTVLGYAHSVWGVFWKQPRYMLAAAVVCRGNEPKAMALAWDLVPVYQRIRQAQPAMVAYIFINTMILTLVGLYLLWTATGRPISRLVRRAEAFTADDDLFLMTESSSNEFDKLSRSLNGMLSRIGQDQESLRAAVRSLEQTNAELIRAQNDVVRAEKFASAGRLAAGIAHEIGNPIGIVLGYLDLIGREGIDDAEKADFIARAQNEIQRINMIIRQLLDIARPAETKPEPVSVHGIIHALVDVVRHQPTLSGIQMAVACRSPRDTVVAVGDQLRQVFLNLILNASDAMAEAGTGPGILTIETRMGRRTETDAKGRGDERIFVRFTDNGIGFSKSSQGDIFDPFFTTKPPGKGTGLGLSVCLSIVEGLGGTIQADSEPGRGTTLTIDLPLAAAEDGTDQPQRHIG